MKTECEPAAPRGADRETVERVEVRPGLVMIRRRTLKPDGRYLLFYDFERIGAGAQEGAG